MEESLPLPADASAVIDLAAEPASEKTSIIPAGGNASGVLARAGMPQRELRLLVDGIRDWLGALTTGKRKQVGALGLLEGEPGQGQAEIFGGLREVCRDLGIHVVWGRAACSTPFPPGAIGEIALQCLHFDRDCREAGAPRSLFSSDILRELEKAARSEALDSRPALPRLGPDLDRSRLVDSMARAAIELSVKVPVIVIVEDLDRADTLTRETVGHLLRLLSSRRSNNRWTPRLLLLASVPAGYDVSALTDAVESGPASLEVFRVRARGLAREDWKDLAGKILGEEGPLSFRERALQATGGNLRHLSWLLWRVKEEGGLKPSRAAERVPPLEVLVKERFQSLAVLERRVVALAAAWGHPFGARFAARVLGLEVGTGTPATAADPAGGDPGTSGPLVSLDDVLPSLADRGFLRSCEGRSCRATPAAGESFSPGAPVHAIASDDIAAWALQAISPKDRREVHRLLAVEAARLGASDDRWLPDVVHQLIEAGDLEGALASTPAASAALERIGAFDAALDLVEKALASARAGRLDTLRVEILRASLLAATQNHQEAVEAYREALRRISAPAERARIHRLVGDLHGRLGEEEARLDAYEEGLEEAHKCPDSLERLKLLAAVARAQLEIRDLDASLSSLDRCLTEMAQRGASVEVDAFEVYRLAEEVHFHRADYAEAAEFELCLLRRFEEAGDVRGQLKSLRHLSHLHALRDEWTDAQTYLLEGLKRAKASGSRCLYAKALTALGLLQRSRKESVNALKSLRRALALFLDLGKTDHAVKVCRNVIALEFETGNFSAAATSIRELLGAWHPSVEASELQAFEGALEPEPEARRRWIRRMEKKSVRGGAALTDEEAVSLVAALEAEGRLADAQSVCRAYLKRDPSPPRDFRARAAFQLGRLCALAGDLEAAFSWFEGALERGARAPRRSVLALAYLEVGAVSLTRGDLGRAFEYLSRGIRLAFEEGSFECVFRALECTIQFFTETAQHEAAVSVAEGLVEVAVELRAPLRQLAALRLLARAEASRKGGSVPVLLLVRWTELASRLECPVETVRLKLESGWTALFKRDHDEALAQGRAGLEAARAAGLSPLIDELLHLVGVIESSARNPKKNFLRALESLEKALAGAEARKCPRLRWEILKDLSTLYRERGKEDLADEYRSRADEIQLLAQASLPPPVRALRWWARTHQAALAVV